MKYAFHNGRAWHVETVDAKGSTGHYPSLAFSSNDEAVITYYDKTKGDLRMASPRGGRWTPTTLDAGSVGTKDVGRFSQLALDPSRPRERSGRSPTKTPAARRYRYAVQGNLLGGRASATTGYTFFNVARAPKLGGYTSLAFDSSNRPAVSFYDSTSTGLRYAFSSGDTFEGVRFTSTTVTEIGAVGSYSNLLFDDEDKPTIYYFDRSRDKATRAVFRAGKWTTSALASRRPRDQRRAVQRHGRVHESR